MAREDGAWNHSGRSERNTWFQEIRPVLSRHCAPGRTHMSLSDYVLPLASGCVANALDVPKWTNSRGVIIRTDAHNSSVLEFESTWERTDSKTGSLSEKCIVWQLFCVLHPFEEQNCVLILVFLPCLYPSLWRLLCPSKAQNTTVSVRVCCVAPSSFSNAG